MGMAMDMDAFYGGSVISPRLREKYGCGALVAQVFEKENKVRLDVESAFAESREITYIGWICGAVDPIIQYIHDSNLDHVE